MTAQLRRLALSNQGLASAHQFGKKLAGTLNAIEHLGYVQIDTLSVVERAHHHVLWSRIAGYDPAYLNQLVADKKIFEYWYHAASYLPIRDYRYALLEMNNVRKGKNCYYNNIDKKLLNEVIARVRAEGPLRARDFDSAGKKKGSWWNYGPAKRAIERLFMQGDLMVCSRVGMEKVYDLAERCLPSDVNTKSPSLSEYANYLFDTTRRAHGVFTLKQLLHLKKGKAIRDAMATILDERIDAGEITVFDNADAPITYIDSKILQETLPVKYLVKILSPFDNVLIHRERLSSLFQFDYKIECYVPAAKRQFGYFTLPILFADKFVGRIDCKAHRAEKRFEVLSFHLEDKKLDHQRFFPALSSELERFAVFNKCPELDQSIIKPQPVSW